MQDFAWPLFSYYLHEKIFVQPFVITTFRYHVIPTFLRLFLWGKWAVWAISVNGLGDNKN